MNFMISVGLTGNRFSGQDTICKLFQDLDVPIFHADKILKFMINHDYLMLERIKDRVGKHVFTSGHVEGSNIKTSMDFDKIIDCAEYGLMKAYDKFNQKNKLAIYTIFHSSILFERGWHLTNFDYTVNVYCPKQARIRRSNMSVIKTTDLLMNEMDDSMKKLFANYTIHNYGSCDLVDQIKEFDQKMVDRYLIEKQTHTKLGRCKESIINRVAKSNMLV